MEGQSPSDGKTQLGAWGALWYNVLITVRVVRNVKEVCLVVGSSECKRSMFGSRSCDYSSENSFFVTANPASSIIYFIKFVLRAVFCIN